MKKFVVLFHDAWEPKPEVMEAWQAWFAAVGDRFIDSGNPFATGREVSRSGASEVVSPDAATGYAIVSAESMDDVERLLEGCPYNSRVRIYEAAQM